MSKAEEWTPGPLGTYTDDDPAAPPKEEPKAEAPPETEKPPKEPAKPETPAQPDEPADEPGDDEDFEEATLEDIDERIGLKVAEAIEKARATPEDEDVDPEVKALREKNADLERKLQQTENEAAARLERDTKAAIKHQVSSASGKYKMTAQEIATVVGYMQANADLVVGESGMKFEEAALRRLPHLRDRLKTSPDTSPRTGDGKAEGVIDAPSSSGPGAPKPWQHTAKPGDYSDITRHELATGGAAKLGHRS